MRPFFAVMLLVLLVGCKPAHDTPMSTLVLLDEAHVNLTISPSNIPVETPLSLVLYADNVKSISAKMVSVSMNMGYVPLAFLAKGDTWQADFMLGACQEPKMIWQLEMDVLYKNGETKRIVKPIQSSW